MQGVSKFKQQPFKVDGTHLNKYFSFKNAWFQTAAKHKNQNLQQADNPGHGVTNSSPVKLV